VATLTHPKGRSVVVPDETVDYYTSKGWAVADSPAEDPAASAKAAEPDKSWKNDELVAYAAEHGIDLGGATKKADLLTAIAAGVKVDSSDESDSQE
jgi:hypothetical protein